MIPVKIPAKNKDIKEIAAFSITGSLAAAIENESRAKNISKSELVEFAMRKLLGLTTDNCRNILNIYYEKTYKETA